MDDNVYVYGHDAVDNTQTEVKNSKQILMPKSDWIRLGKASGASLVTFWTAFWGLRYMAPNWPFWLVVVLAFSAALMVLKAIDSAVVTKSGLGKSITYFIIVMSGFVLVGHYADKNQFAPKLKPAADTMGNFSHQETSTLHPGEIAGFPEFSPGDNVEILVEYASVGRIQPDGPDITIAPGRYKLEINNKGAPVFRGLGQLTKVTIFY